ncbi:MAG: hypothetical protein AAGD14_04830 [Planctomycetota bacterium]
MRRILWLPLVLLATLHAEDTKPGFPASWKGSWKGPCRVVRAGQPDLSFPMELHVAPIEESGRWTWRIVYGEGAQRQERAYELVPKEGNHYVIDEKNSILIDSYLEGENLRSRFGVSGNSLEVTYARRGDELDVTITTFAARPVRTSGGEARVPPVTSYALKAVQRATLRRSAPADSTGK